MNACGAQVEWKPFDFLIIITILCNCIALAVYSPFPMDDTDETNLILVGGDQSITCRAGGTLRRSSSLSPPTGKGGICFSSNFYCRVRDEDHSVRVVATLDRVPPECLEPVRFYNCHDRVRDTHRRLAVK